MLVSSPSNSSHLSKLLDGQKRAITIHHIYHVLPDAGQLSLKLLTPLQTTGWTEESHHIVLLCDQLDELSLVNYLQLLSRSKAQYQYKEDPKATQLCHYFSHNHNLL